MKQENTSEQKTPAAPATAHRGIGAERPSRRTLDGHTRPCEDCGAVNWNLDISRGEITCEDCGLVAEENVPDPGAEWTNRDNGEDRSRVGRPMTYTLADKGLGRAASETSSRPTNSSATAPDFPHRSKKRQHGSTDGSLAKGSSPAVRSLA
jgi:hypothetical protein